MIDKSVVKRLAIQCGAVYHDLSLAHEEAQRNSILIPTEMHLEAFANAVIENYKAGLVPVGENNHPVIDLGYGLIEVAEGTQDGKLSLIFGKNGNGILGAKLVNDRTMAQGEAIAVITFANVECLEVVQDKLNIIRDKLPLYTLKETK